MPFSIWLECALALDRRRSLVILSAEILDA